MKMQILIIDLGSQYTLVIARLLREMGYRSLILSSAKANSWLKKNSPQAIILSGGSASVYEKNSPTPPKTILNKNIPLLGICYGMQWLTKQLGGKVVAQQKNREYGENEIIINNHHDLFYNLKQKKIITWASHGDSVKKLPPGFKILATATKAKTIEAIGDKKRRIWGLQFHPEVTHTQQGKAIIKNFIAHISHCQKDWQAKNIIAKIQEETRVSVSSKKSIIGFSGGIDSTVLSAILSPVLKNNLLGLTIDTGALRKNEIESIKFSAKQAGIKLKIIQAKTRFQKALTQVVDAEKKRQIFKKLYVTILEEEAKKFKADFIIQGSLATDYIESGNKGKATLIKSHHNIGNSWQLNELHPLKELFKYEIRSLAKALKLPSSIVQKQPFPGPGLFLRIVGTPITAKKLKLLKEIDFTVTNILTRKKVLPKLSQLIVALIGIKTVGIKGDKRSYAYPVVIRAVKTKDFMTVSGVDFSRQIKKEIEKAVTKHTEINRVWFDVTDKPPATTELE